MGRILVADDERGVRMFIADTLKLAGHDVVAVEDGQAAADALAKQAFELLVTDLKMPRMDGMTLVRKVRAEHPDVEVIMLTAHGTVSTAVEAMKAGVFDYLSKPIDSPTELRLLADRALERRALRARKAHDERQTPAEVQLTWGAPAMLPVVDALERVAKTQATVLLTGESGVGKEVAARRIHALSPRNDGPFGGLNCATLSEHLVESELFGHEKGAFTGAHARRRGRIELASSGTLFLDEVGELRPDFQAKLLRVLQERRYERIGGAQTLHADVRWIAATNRDLAHMIGEGTFRDDLYHRLAVFPIRIPPLRERREDIPPLAAQLLGGIARDLARPRLVLAPETVTRLQSAPWPGNVRQLRNVLERAAILTDGQEILPAALMFDELAQGAHSGPSSGSDAVIPLVQVERRAIENAVAAADGNRTKAAEMLGIGVRTLYDKLKKYGA